MPIRRSVSIKKFKSRCKAIFSFSTIIVAVVVAIVDAKQSKTIYYIVLISHFYSDLK